MGKIKQTQAPVSSGDIINDLEIVTIGIKGDGIGIINHFVIIVPETIKGKIYKVEITKVLRNVAFGVVIL